MSSSTQKPIILAVDDNLEALLTLKEALQRRDFQVFTATSGTEALSLAPELEPDIILLDVNMPGLDGLAVTRKLKADPDLRFTPIVLVTANDTLDALTSGFEAGADDYIKKPFDLAELTARLKAVMRTRALYRELRESKNINRSLSQQLGERRSFANIIGKSQAMQQVFDLIEKVKDAQAPLLVTGETGTGKELVAAALHNSGRRREKPFVAQNCAAFNENLLESELFGHVRGAFTGAIRDKVGLFEAADGGTLFLDEVGEMSPALQVKLLRVLQEGTLTPVGSNKSKKVDVRVIAATHRDLEQMVGAGTFREDLFYRLHVVNIVLPPLRNRREDIPLLIEFFLKRHVEKNARSQISLAPETLRILSDYSWPGNIRELENEVERLVLLAGTSTIIGEGMLSARVKSQTSAAVDTGSRPPNLKSALEQLERSMIAEVLGAEKGNKSEAARVLGISRSSLISKVQAYGLDSDSEEK